MRQIILCVLFVTIAPASAHGQGEAYLRQFFQNKTVILRIDMPASKHGVNLHPRRTPVMDAKGYGEWLAASGIGIRAGESAVISKIDVRKNHIEIHLNEGGGSMSFWEALRTDHRIPKELGRTTEAELAVKALREGSRFNIRYPGPVPTEAQTPEAVVRVLAEYVEFPEETFGPQALSWVESARSSTAMAVPAPGPARGQSEADLKRFFEGKSVVVKVDMPAMAKGVDVHPDRSPTVDPVRLAGRMAERGVGVGIGEAIIVTKVDVHKDLIEFLLGGGGFAEFDVPDPEQLLPSKREDELDKQIDAETDRAKRKELEKEQEHLEREREKEQETIQERYEEAKANAAVEGAKFALRAGSRFRLHFNNGRVPPEALKPDFVMKALSEFVDFPEETFGSRSATVDTARVAPAAGAGPK